MKKWLVLFLFAVPLFSQSSSTILSANRATDWTQAGISGGIPNFTLQCGSTIPSSASAATIISAVSACANTNKYVLLGAGTFNLSSAIRNVGVSGVELRGSGPQSTKLVFSAGSTCQGGNGNCLVSFEAANLNCTTCGPTFHNVTGGLTKGSTTVTFDSVSGWVVGQDLIFDQCDTSLSGSTGSPTCTGTSADNNALYVSEYSTLSSDRSVAFNNGNGTERPKRGQEEVVTITNITGLNVTFDVPIINANWDGALFPQGWTTTTASNLPIHDVGISNLSINGTGLSNVHGASFDGADRHWITNVVVQGLPNISIVDWMSVHGIIQSNYLYSCGQFNPSNDYSGINVANFGTTLIANNIFHGCGVSPQFNGPGAGAVVVGNYAIYAFNGPQFWAQHAAGVHYVLYEENIAKDWFADQIHGPALMNTLYRNLLQGWQSCANVGTSGCGTQTNLWPIGDLSYNRYENIVANILGNPVIQGVGGSGYSVSLDFNYFTFSGTGSGSGTYIYNLGSGNAGNAPVSSAQWPHDPIVESTLVRWGNWDAHNAAVLECTAASTPIAACAANERGNSAPTYPGLASPSTTFPASFYYPTPPDYWGSRPWPAIGPDVTGGNVGICSGTINTAGHYSGVAATSGTQCTGTTLISAWAGQVNAIPAMDCYLNTLNGPPDGSGGILPFDAANCYTATPAVTLTVTNTGTGSGTVTGTNCTTGTYTSGTSIGTCTATASGGSSLTSLIGTGSASCSGSTCSSFSITAASTITASFMGTVVTPTFSPTTLSSPGFVTISSTTPASSCFYTVDGSTPTTGSVKFIYPLFIAQPQTLKAICSATGYTNSAVATQAFSPTVPKIAIGISAIAASENTNPFPNPNRSLAVEWNDVLTSPTTNCNSYNWTALDAWVAKSTAKGVVNMYTFSHVPQCANASTDTACPPTDVSSGVTMPGCPASPANTSDTFFKNFQTAFWQHACGVGSVPVTPLPSTSCKNFKFVETWNEDNADNYWKGTYALKAIMDNDMAHIVYQYCSDCIVILGSTSAGGSGSHANGQSGFYDVALLAEATAWQALSPFYAPRGISIHDYWSRANVVPPPMVTTLVSHADSACTGGNTPNGSCYVPVYQEFSRIQGSAVLLNAAIKPWAANLPVYGSEGGYGHRDNLCSVGSPDLCIAGIAQHMYAVAAQNTSTKSIPFDLLYASNTCTTPNDWGCFWNNGSSPQLPAINQVIAILAGHSITGILSSTPITGGNKWTLALDSGNAEIDWCDAWTPTVCTTTTSFSAQTTTATTANPSGVTSAIIGGALSLTQAPVFLFNSTQAATPTFSPVAGSYGPTQNVTISTSTSGATLCYTTNGTTPSSSTAGSCAAGSTQYVSPVSVSTSLTLKAIATKAGLTDSTVASAAYVINGTVAAVTFSPVAGSYATTQTVTLSTVTSAATICFTIDGSTPTATTPGTCSHGTTYTVPITVSTSQTVRALGSKAAFVNSSLSAATYTINGTVATPTFSPVAGTYTGTQSATISSSTGGATLCYTTDGSTPTGDGAGACTHGTTYTVPVSVAVSETLKAIGTLSTFTDSAAGSAAYVITVATPTFSPVAGAYAGTQTVTISTTTSAATLCYTTDGSTPTADGAGTCTHGTTYTVPVSVASSLTLKAVGSKSGLDDSGVGSAAYVINGTVATPTFSPVAGTYVGAQSVTIASATAGATLCYTTDGSTPTANGAGNCTHGTIYTSPVSVGASLTLKAIGSKNVYSDSTVGSAAYVITAAPGAPLGLKGTVKFTGTVSLPN